MQYLNRIEQSSFDEGLSICSHQDKELALRQRINQEAWKSFKRISQSSREFRNKVRITREIVMEHKLFRIMKAWQSITHDSLQKCYQGEVLEDQKRFNRVRAVFNAWKERVVMGRRADFFYKKKRFEQFKLACLTELGLRVRRIELTRLMTQNRIKQLALVVKLDQKRRQGWDKMVNSHAELSILMRYFSQWRATMPNLRRENFEYKQYKLAFIFHRHRRLQNCFRTLIAVGPNC